LCGVPRLSFSVMLNLFQHPATSRGAGDDLDLNKVKVSA